MCLRVIVDCMTNPPSKHETFTQCWFMLGQRHRRWTNNTPTLVQCLVFAALAVLLFGAVVREHVDIL